MKSNRIKLYDRTLENDIKYKAPLSYRYIRIIAWVCLLIAQICMLAKINIKIVPSSEPQLGWLRDLGEWFSSMPLPLFLLANFAAIFQKRDNYKKLLLFYGGVAALLYIVGNIVIIHYGYGFINAFTFGSVDFWTMAKVFGGLLFSLGPSGLVFNIFIDLLLCSLLFFFMNYKPKKYFQGKNLKWFRLMFILPILYEIASILIKYFVGMGQMSIPFFFFFLLTSKPPLMFLAFVILVLLLKIQEIKGLKRHQNHKLIEENRKTNAHSFRFSLSIAIVFLIMGVLDILLYFFLSVIFSFSFGFPDPESMDMAIGFGKYVVDHMGFGKAAVLIIIAPITLLFSYTKTHKNPKIDTYIPIVAIALILFTYIEGMFQIITVNVSALMQKIADIISEAAEDIPIE